MGVSLWLLSKVCCPWFFLISSAAENTSVRGSSLVQFCHAILWHRWCCYPEILFINYQFCVLFFQTSLTHSKFVLYISKHCFCAEISAFTARAVSQISCSCTFLLRKILPHSVLTIFLSQSSLPVDLISVLVLAWVLIQLLLDVYRNGNVYL